MLAFVLGHKLSVLNDQFRTGDYPQLVPLQLGYDSLLSQFGSVAFRGPIANAVEQQQVVCGALALYGIDQTSQAQDLLSLCSSRAAFEDALLEIVRDHFNEPTWQPA